MKKEERERVWPKFCFDFGLSAANAPERVLTESKRERRVYPAYPRCNISAIARLSSSSSSSSGNTSTDARKELQCAAALQGDREEEEAVEGFEKY